jgi:hypothetical protein
MSSRCMTVNCCCWARSAQMEELNGERSVFFAFAKVEYQDIRTGSKYWTHICVRYIPKMRTDTDNGFRNCTEYNDAN